MIMNIKLRQKIKKESSPRKFLKTLMKVNSLKLTEWQSEIHIHLLHLSQTAKQYRRNIAILSM